MNMMKRPTNLDFLIIAGPTASGKSHLAIELAKEWNGEIINADSMQVYKDLSILTARPQPHEQTVPHHLYGVLSPNENSSAAWWVEQTCQLIKDCIKRGRLPIVVGGTGFYLHALTKGLSHIPDIDPSIREQARKLSCEQLVNDFAEYVYILDPLIRSHIRPTDIQRLTRALEVFLQTGISLITWQEKTTPPLSYHYEYVVIEPERSLLYDVINERFQLMVENGALKEVEKLVQLDPPPSSPIMKAIGVPELMAYLKEEISLTEAIEQAQKNTRRYAKRQTTWFRHQPRKKIVIYRPDIDTLMKEFCTKETCQTP
jgi:tRNA dimethylallyltransferase